MIIALTGPAGCGKSTIARALERDHSFVRLRFAGPIKDMLRALGLTEAQVDGDEKELPCELLGGLTPRWAMRLLGDWGRNIHPDFWVRPTMAKVDELSKAHRDVVIDDLRFDNEARALAGRRAVIIQLRRNGTAPSTVHASEQGIAKGWLTAYVDNNGTIEEAVHTVLTIAEARRSQGRHGL